MGDFRKIYPTSRHPLTPGCDCGEAGEETRSLHHPQCKWRAKTIPMLTPDGTTSTLNVIETAIEVVPAPERPALPPAPGPAFPGSLGRQLDDIFAELRKIDVKLAARPSRTVPIGEGSITITVGQAVHYNHPNTKTCVAGLITYIYQPDEVEPDEALTGVAGTEWVDMVVFGRKSWSIAPLVCRDEMTRLPQTWHLARPHT